MLPQKLNALPFEIIIQIIGYLPTKDIIENVSLVSRQLNLLSKDSFVKISVSFTRDSTPEKAINIFEQRSSQIKDLTIANISEETQKVLTTQIGALKNLQKCTVVFSEDQTFKFPLKFFSQLFQLKHLKDLELCGYNFEESSLKTIGECQQLKRLIVNFTGSDIISKQEFKSVANLREINYIWVSFAMNFEADLDYFPEEPLHLEKKNLLDHCYFFRFQNFTPSHLRMIAAQMPNCCAFAIHCETFEIDSPEYMSALHYLFRRCKRLAFFFCMECKINDLNKFKETFSDWSFWKYNFENNKGKLGMFKGKRNIFEYQWQQLWEMKFKSINL